MTMPDCRGNDLFNIFRSLLLTPNAGLLFIDFKPATKGIRTAQSY